MVATALRFSAVVGVRGFESRPLRRRQLVEQETLNLLVRALTRRTTNQGQPQRRRRSLVPEPSSPFALGGEAGIQTHVPELIRRVEPTTNGLTVRCSTAEPQWIGRDSNRAAPRS
jgi:hypothetical protein